MEPQYGQPLPPQMPPAGPQPMQPGYAPGVYYPPPRRKRRVWLIVLLLAGIPLLGVGGLVAIGVAYSALSKEAPASAADKKLVLTVADVAPFVRYQPKPGLEKATRTTKIDGSWEVKNVYNDEGKLFMTSIYFHEDSLSSAQNIFSGQELGTKIGYAKGGGNIEEVPKNELFKWGDESHFYLIKKNGKPIGNRFVARKGNNVIYMIMSGVYFNKPKPTHDFLDPVMQRIDAAD